MSKVRTTLEALERHYTAANLAPGQPLPGVHQEGKSPLVPAEETGELLPDGRPKRKLPDIVDGMIALIQLKWQKNIVSSVLNACKTESATNTQHTP